MAKRNLQPRVIGVNILGAIGYMLMLGVWALLLAVIITFLIERGIIASDVIIREPSQTETSSSGFATGFAYVITAIMILVSLAVLVALPYLFGKWSSRSLRWLLAKIKVVPTKRHMFLAKSLMTALPLVGFFIVTLTVTELTITFSIIYVVAVCLAALAIIFFFAQLMTARRLAVIDEKVW